MKREQIAAMLAARRADKAFTDRLAQRMAEDAPLLERLKDGECSSAHLIESRDGGAVLTYECDQCGARLTRTRDQAESDAAPVSPERDDTP